MKTVTIKHVTRIEGHATFWGALKKGNIPEARYLTLEGARLIEGILIGRNYMDAPLVTARICGVCPIVHNLTAIKALENAMRVCVSPGTVVLRKLMMLAQTITSHAVHAYFMAIPDFYGKDSALDLLAIAPKQSALALKIRDYGNRISHAIGGRNLHPVNSQVGGFLKLPNRRVLELLLADSQEVMMGVVELAHFISHLKFPDFHRKTEYISLRSSREYSIYDGTAVVSTNGLRQQPSLFMRHVREIQSDDDYVKRTTHKGEAYFVGALSRVNNNWRQLNPIARQAFRHLGHRMPIDNPFYNVWCQGVELIHCVEETQKLLAQYLRMKHQKPMAAYTVRAGKGVGAIEAPRGILLHYYETDRLGILKNVNIITPTAQMINNLEVDLEHYLRAARRHAPDARKLGTLIRAYDPCMTCATH
ncbi:MAG: nickel-dependent hydrogenase large subunit [Patescibacteria group bacterium]|nr:nickel-dependent hydrogenase large subunit [Patescibacteria group bacterium]MDD5715198.1 nickel-dependent hydrogenase large subunit [Patescibacteria group bacterium]